jgi:hypothetical protein
MYGEVPRRAVFVKYSTVEFIDGNLWLLRINDWLKPAQSAHLSVQFRCHDTVRGGVGICTFIGQWWSLPCGSGGTDR